MSDEKKVPGIMSQPELIDELVNEYDYSMSHAKAMTWPQLIQAVKEERELNVPMPAPIFLGMPDTLDYIFDGHMGASPSGAERWMRCTKSLGLSRAFLETLSPNQLEAMAAGSLVSRAGTTAHTAGAAGLDLMQGNITQDEYDAVLMELATLPETETEAYDEEMAEHVQTYIDLVSHYHNEGRQVLIETRVEATIPLVGSMEGEVHSISGSGDTIVLPSDSESEIIVIDYKHGEGIDVDVEENSQTRIYGLGALELLADENGDLEVPVDTIRYFIVQPRSGGVKEWTETIEELLDWRDDVLAPSLTAALTGEGAEYMPEPEVCQWCVAKGACPALIETRVSAAADMFDAIVDDELKATDLLTDVRLGELLAQAMGVDKIVKDLKEEAQRRLHRGAEVPGFRLVNYTPPRTWKPEAEERLSKTASLWKKPVLITPTQALAINKGKPKALAALEKLIDTPEKKPVIGRTEGDNRKTWEGRPPEQMFDDLPEEE